MFNAEHWWSRAELSETKEARSNSNDQYAGPMIDSGGHGNRKKSDISTNPWIEYGKRSIIFPGRINLRGHFHRN